MGNVPRHLAQPSAVPPPLPPSAPQSTFPERSQKDAERRRESILNPSELDRFKNLLAFARSVVEGFLVGKHRSPDFGSNAEFAEYLPYYTGASVSDIDWRIYARTRKLMLRRYLEETDMVVYLVVDSSGSMAYKGSGNDGEKRDPKYIHAAKLAAALSYLMTRQGDKVALSMYGEKMRRFLPAGGTKRHLYHLIDTLEGARTDVVGGTDLASSLSQCASLFKKRGRLVILSDFYGDLDEIFDSLGPFVHRGFDALLLQIADPEEVSLPETGVAEFVDMETGERIQVDPAEIRKTFREIFEERTKAIADGAVRRGMEHQLVTTDQPYRIALEKYLGFRGAS